MAKKSGWYEGQQFIVTPDGIQKKAPEHYKASINKKLEDTLRAPLVVSKWTEKKIIDELNAVTKTIGYFPRQKDFKRIGRIDLLTAINRTGGLSNYSKYGYIKYEKETYWTEDQIVNTLKEVATELGYFPSYEYIRQSKWKAVLAGVDKNGGLNKFKKLCNYPTFKMNYWNEETTLEEIKKYINEHGHFPKAKELERTKKYDLLGAINSNGGFRKFQKIVKVSPYMHEDGYWTLENTINDIRQFIIEHGHFPVYSEIYTIKKYSKLAIGIARHGGIFKLREAMGYPTSAYDQYIAESASYTSKRGKKSENMVEAIIRGWCKSNGQPEPLCNIKLAKQNVVEFVCNITGKRIAIDVTNTKTKSGWAIRRKYLEKDYHKYLDKLWIVVLSDIFTTEDYLKFNQESPDNVEIMSVWDLIETLQVDIDEHSRRKLEALETCTLRTKNDLINQLKNRSLSEFA